MRDRVHKAIQHWEKYTCLKFQQYDSIKHKYYKSRLVFQMANLCGSYVGYQQDVDYDVVPSNVYLGEVCSIGNIIHELGHTIGFRHEQARLDRDEHVKINTNKLTDDLNGQYSKMDDSQPNYYNVKYDLFSIMQYGTSDKIIQALDPSREFLMGQRVGLSFLDIEMANKAYYCSGFI